MIHMHNTPMKCQLEAINIVCYTANRIFLDREQIRHLMNYGLEENLTLTILGLLTVSATFLGIGKTLESLILNLIQLSSQVILLLVQPIGFIIKIHKSSRNLPMQLLMTLSMICGIQSLGLIINKSQVKKRIFKNKQDENGVIVRNRATLVA